MMNLTTVVRRRLHWLNLPGALLIALLQRTPVLRVAAVAEEFVLASPVGTVLRSAAATVASLGALHTLAGATTPAPSSGSPLQATVGTPITVVAFGLTGTQTPASSWIVSGSLPPGLTINGQGSIGTFFSPFLALNGTPTVAGTFQLSIVGSDQGFVSDPLNYAIVVTGSSATTPAITTQPSSQTVNPGATATFTAAATGSPTPTFQWRKNGVNITGATSATLTLTNVSALDAAAYTVVVTNSAGSVTSNPANLTVNAATVTPSITTQPLSQIAGLGQTIIFTVVATGTPAPTYQWQKNGVIVPGVTTATLTLPNVQTTDAGVYVVLVTNSAGTVTSTAATLTVNATVNAPAFTAQPVSQTIAAGSTVVFTAVANGAPTPTYQWRRNGTDIAGATSATLVLTGANVIAGTYTVVAANSVSSVTSAPANLTLATGADSSRLTNLSVVSTLSSRSDSFSLGYVVSGASATNLKPLVIRAAGPSLGALGFPGTLDDPKLELFAGPTKTGENEDWGGSAATTAAMAAVGGFAYVGPTSRDAAVATNITSSDNSVKITVGTNSVTGAGAVIAEVYDATPTNTITASTPRLVNFSVIKPISAGGSLTLGFTIGGSTAKTVLIRAVGPGLAAVGVTSGTLGDPQLTLFNSGSVAIATNDDWGADPQLTTAGSRVGAFNIGNAPTKDAMLIITLPAGGYTARVTGGGNSSGLAIVEVYEVP